jgi:hypothetical protein
VASGQWESDDGTVTIVVVLLGIIDARFGASQFREDLLFDSCRTDQVAVVGRGRFLIRGIG